MRFGPLLAVAFFGAAVPAQLTLVDGWTQFVAEPGARIVHVSSQGNDSFPGTQAQPKRTLAAGMALLRNGSPDWLLLRRGDTWQIPSEFRFDRTGPATGPGWMRLGAYGDLKQPRPVLDGVNNGRVVLTPGFRSSTRMANIAITDIHILASNRLANSASAVSGPFGLELMAVEWQGTGFAFSNIMVENVRITGFRGGILSFGNCTNLTIRRCIFDHIFDLIASGANGVMWSPTNGLLEDNVFYRVQSADTPGVSATISSHAVYGVASAVNAHARGNIVIKAYDGMMLRHGGDWLRNVSAFCYVGGAIGQAWGVTPTPGGVVCNMQDSLVMNLTSASALFLGNTNSGQVRRNMFLHDQNGTMPIDLVLVPASSTSQGQNIGVHNTTFEGNFLTGAIQYNQSPTSFSGLVFQNNAQRQGTVSTSIGAYLAAAGIPGTTVDDWANHLLRRDRSNFAATHLSTSVLNHYRQLVGLPPLR